MRSQSLSPRTPITATSGRRGRSAAIEARNDSTPAALWATSKIQLTSSRSSIWTRPGHHVAAVPRTSASFDGRRSTGRSSSARTATARFRA